MNNKTARAMLTHWPWPMSVIICLPQQVQAIYEIELQFIYLSKFLWKVLFVEFGYKVRWNNENIVDV